MDARRGSGVSIPATQSQDMPKRNTMDSFGSKSGKTPNIGMYPYPYAQPSQTSFYVQPPGFMSPYPPTQAYPPQFGYPPMMYPSDMMAQYQAPRPQHPQFQNLQYHQMSQPQQLARSGSVNARIFSADARRPFGGAGGGRPENLGPIISKTNNNTTDIKSDGYWTQGQTCDFGGAMVNTTAQERDSESCINALRADRSQEEQDFIHRIKLWEEQVGGRPENDLQGLTIEEIPDSASCIEDKGECKNIESASQVGGSVLGRDQFSASIPGRMPVRWKNTTPINTAVMFVPQQEAWVVERMGKFSRVLDPGLNLLIPVIDKVKYVQSLKEITIDIPQQTAISADNVTINIDGVLYLRVMDPYKASYGVEDPEFAITQLAQTTMRSEIGKISLDAIFRERESLNVQIVQAINSASEAWGIQCMRYEIRDIKLPTRVQEAMQMQVEAERKKRAAILESEGIKAADINIAEGKKQSRILQSEAEKQEMINAAEGAARAVVAAGEARAKSIDMVSEALQHENGNAAANLAVAEKYVTAFGNLAKESNTILLPSNPGDVTGMVTQAMTIYQRLNNQGQPRRLEQIAETKETENNKNLDKLD